MSMKKCYFAYTWEDDDTKLPQFLSVLKEEVETRSEGEIEIIFDKMSFKTGDNFEKKEELIYLSDSIVLFFSPNYKRIVEKQDDKRGVYREYKKIKEVKTKGIAGIVPIIVEGDEKTAITNDFKKNIAEIVDINDIFTKGQNKIKRKYEKKVENIIGKIIKETDLAYKKRDYEFESVDDMMEVLFGEAAANKKLPHKCMYKTDAYVGVLAQNRRYIVGRKGSGKTTFFELLEKYDVDAFEKKFKVLKPINAEEINMEQAYSTLNSFSSDNALFSLNKRLELFWEIYTYICAIYIVCLEEELFKIEDERREIFRKVGNVFRDQKFNVEKLTDEKCHEALFVSAISTFGDFFKGGIIEHSKDESFIASLVANYNIDNVLELYFGKILYKKLKKAILKCRKKVIIALDGFDRVSELFRTGTISLINSSDIQRREEGKNRLEFEGLFYRSMFNVFEKLRKSTKGIMSKVSFCIIIPQDKLDQIKESDRDFSKYKFASLSWDAIDLLQMLIIRLEYVYGIVDCKDIVEKFERIMKKHFSTIPLRIQISIEGKDEGMHLFEYLLRISFWRPRDIITYFYEIYLANKNNINGRKELSSDTIKSILNKKANDIIDEEFYAEYRTVITNIEEIMEQFRGKDILMNLDELYQILYKQSFKTAALREFNKPYDKLKMLYELNVLGIWVNKNIMAQENLRCYLCFNYNEGLDPLDILKGNKKFTEKEIKIVINPIFSKKLSLQYNTKEILEKYGWEYFLENHIRKSSIKRI